MSYAKAMKHARNVKKSKKQANMYFGFSTGSGSWPSFRSTPYGKALSNVREWFKWRHFDYKEKGYKYIRECIKEQIEDCRKFKPAE